MPQSKLIVGQCIYCGATSQPLTREHVMPRGLGGGWQSEGHHDALVLQKASCPSCQNVTQKIEHDCLRAMMGPARARLGLTRQDRISGKLRASIKHANGQLDERELPLEEVPGALAIPSFYEAGLFSGGPIIDSKIRCDYQLLVVAPARANPVNSARIGVAVKADATSFARMLAKIGLGLAVAKYGIGGFRPLVRDLILSKPEESGYWVGGFAGQQIGLPKTANLHEVRLTTHEAAAGVVFIVAEIRLFAEFGGPTNYVVVGQPL